MPDSDVPDARDINVRAWLWALVLGPWFAMAATIIGVVALSSSIRQLAGERAMGNAGPSIRDHFEACEGEEPKSDILTTNWTSGGMPETKSTERDPGESDEDFIDSHAFDAAVCMVDNKPDDDTDLETGRFEGTPDSVTTTVEYQ